MSESIAKKSAGTGDLSDGYHTFNELYHHRAVLFSVICNLFPDKAWKSKRHHTGEMYEGMFIVGIETPQGQATYHYDIEPYWDMFRVKELEYAPEWDGHTSDEAIERIGRISDGAVALSRSEIAALNKYREGLNEEVKDNSLTIKRESASELADTVVMMNSDDYKVRFIAEYRQTKIRYTKLHNMIVKADAGTLEFNPTCPIKLLREQKAAMGKYLYCLEVRAQIEGIKLE